MTVFLDETSVSVVATDRARWFLVLLDAWQVVEPADWSERSKGSIGNSGSEAKFQYRVRVH